MEMEKPQVTTLINPDTTTDRQAGPRRTIQRATNSALARKVLTIMYKIIGVVACWLATPAAAKQFMGADLHNPITFIGLSLLGIALGWVLTSTNTDS